MDDNATNKENIMRDSHTTVEDALENLSQWVNWNGQYSHDVCDVQAIPFFTKSKVWANKGIAFKIITKPILYIESHYRSTLRKIFYVKKMRYPQASGLFARGYLKLYKINKDEKLAEKAIEHLDWLSSNSTVIQEKMAWGQPYNWPSKILIPAYTPRATVTSIVLMAFLDAWEILGDKKYQEVAINTANFIAECLPRKEMADGSFCFNYTTIDNFTIHNANMVAAASLCRAGVLMREPRWVKLALRAADFTARDQNINGSWFYHYPKEPISKIDHYHTGFVLEAFMDIEKSLGKDFPFHTELKKGLDFYLKNMFYGCIPKMTEKEVYPIDVQSCAQAILTLSSASKYDSSYANISDEVAVWTINNLQNNDGSFYYRIYKHKKDTTPYLRWGQSWMFRALTSVLQEKRK